MRFPVDKSRETSRENESYALTAHKQATREKQKRPCVRARPDSFLAFNIFDFEALFFQEYLRHAPRRPPVGFFLGFQTPKK